MDSRQIAHLGCDQGSSDSAQNEDESERSLSVAGEFDHNSAKRLKLERQRALKAVLGPLGEVDDEFAEWYERMGWN